MTTLIDARSPAEYLQGHIPGAINMPLLDNDQRAQVGLCYKQKGHKKAVELGFDLVGPKMGTLIRSAHYLTPPFTIYCWRGGLRSNTLTWILSTAGFPCSTRDGGYKRYRRETLDELARPRKIQLLDGLTGCGKTELLVAMQEQGKQVLNLEEIANHRGSAFGAIGMDPQPTNEHFENCIAAALINTDPTQTLWIENESRFIGKLKIPDPLFNLMQHAPATVIEKTREERLARIIQDYGSASQETLMECVEKLQKKLGGQRTKQITELIQNNELSAAFSLLLDYYDHAYTHSQRKGVLV